MLRENGRIYAESCSWKNRANVWSDILDINSYHKGDIDKKYYDDGIIIEIEKDTLCNEKIYHVIWRKEYPQTNRTSEWELYSKISFNPVFYLLK